MLPSRVARGPFSFGYVVHPCAAKGLLSVDTLQKKGDFSATREHKSYGQAAAFPVGSDPSFGTLGNSPWLRQSCVRENCGASFGPHRTPFSPLQRRFTSKRTRL